MGVGDELTVFEVTQLPVLTPSAFWTPTVAFQQDENTPRTLIP